MRKKVEVSRHNRKRHWAREKKEVKVEVGEEEDKQQLCVCAAVVVVNSDSLFLPVCGCPVRFDGQMVFSVE